MNKKNSLAALELKIKKTQGQLAKVAAMVSAGDYCIDIIQQNLAVIGLLKSIQQDLLTHHLNHCFQAGLDNPKKRRQMTEELVKVFNYFSK
jgi:DNA-binding FrmR family transcriptional regulator